MKTKYCLVLFRIFFKRNMYSGLVVTSFTFSQSILSSFSCSYHTCSLSATQHIGNKSAKYKKIHTVMGTFLGKNIKFSYANTSAKYGHFGYFQSLLGPCLYKYK